MSNKPNNTLKKLGISTALVTTALVGYSAVRAFEGDTTLVASDQSDVAIDQRVPQGTPPAGGRGGHGGHHDEENQTLSENAFDPSQVVTVPADSASTTVEATADPEATAEAITDGMYVDGQYVGDAVTAQRWGTMQVVVVIENGELTDVLIADYPHSTNLSNVLSRNGIPILISEAIEAQSSDIDVVSRATDTSRAFITSLESALEDALVGNTVSDSAS